MSKFSNNVRELPTTTDKEPRSLCKDVARLFKGLAIGSLHGAYTPFFLTSGIGHNKEPRGINDEYFEELLGDAAGQTYTALAHVPLALYAVSNGYGKEYFGALIATNVIDYLAHFFVKKYDEAKERAEEEALYKVRPKNMIMVHRDSKGFLDIK